MAAASGEAAAAALLAQRAPVDDEDIGDFLARVEEVNAQIKLLKEGVAPDAVTTVRPQILRQRFIRWKRGVILLPDAGAGKGGGRKGTEEGSCCQKKAGG